jgi:hypothetical protein
VNFSDTTYVVRNRGNEGDDDDVDDDDVLPHSLRPFTLEPLCGSSRKNKRLNDTVHKGVPFGEMVQLPPLSLAILSKKFLPLTTLPPP